LSVSKILHIVQQSVSRTSWQRFDRRLKPLRAVFSSRRSRASRRAARYLLAFDGFEIIDQYVSAVAILLQPE